MTRLKKIHVYLCLLCFIMTLVSACSQPTTNAARPNAVASPSATSTPTEEKPVNTDPIPEQPTTCPAPGTARAAFMPAMSGKGHASIVYVTTTRYSDGVIDDKSTSTSVLKRYDTVTKQKVDVTTRTIFQKLTNNQTEMNAITSPIMSDDGQWIAFATVVDGRRAIQIIRADGQGLQTLYCTPVEASFWHNLSFSPGAKYLSFNELALQGSEGYPKNAANALNLIELATGKIIQAAAVPLPTPAIYEVVQWRNDTSLYISKGLIGIGGGQGAIMTRNRRAVFLLSNILDQDSLQPVVVPAVPNGSGDSCKDFDFNANTAQILVSDCPGRGGVQAGTIGLFSDANANPQIIFQTQKAQINYARFLDANTVWFSATSDDKDQAGLWKVNTDGSNLQRLSAQPFDFDLWAYSQPQHLSLDAQLYAFVVGNKQVVGQPFTYSLLIGSVAGSEAVVIEPKLEEARLIGWTAL